MKICMNCGYHETLHFPLGKKFYICTIRPPKIVEPSNLCSYYKNYEEVMQKTKETQGE